MSDREAQRAAALERAKGIKKKQEEALAGLPPNTLYIALYLRSDPPTKNDFHWALYLHKGATGGTKYQVENPYNGYMPNHSHTGNIFKDNFLCVLIRLATIPEEVQEQFDQIVRSHDEEIQSIPGVTCRVWLLLVIGELAQHGILHCDSVKALESECMEKGNLHSASAAENEQPRPVVESQCAGDRHAAPSSIDV